MNITQEIDDIITQRKRRLKIFMIVWYIHETCKMEMM